VKPKPVEGVVRSRSPTAFTCSKIDCCGKIFWPSPQDRQTL
jgi:hypothetical protein